MWPAFEARGVSGAMPVPGGMQVVAGAMRGRHAVAPRRAMPVGELRHGVFLRGDRGGLWCVGWAWSAVLLLGCVGRAWSKPPPGLPPDGALAARLLETAGDGFRIRETKHFTIAYDTSHETVAALVGRLEGIYTAVWRFCEGMGVEIHPPGARLEVILFDSYGDYTAYCAAAGLHAASMAGFYHHKTNLATFCNAVHRPGFARLNREIDRLSARLRDRSHDLGRGRSAVQRRFVALRSRRDAAVERFNRLVIQHEAAHQILFNIGVHVRGGQVPDWLAEGLACQFEVPQARAARGLARTNQYRLADFRDALGLGADARRVSDAAIVSAVRAGRLVRLRDLVGDADSFARRDEHLMYRYAQAWALVSYLQRVHRDRFSAYVSRLARRAPGVVFDGARERAAFESVVGPLDAAMERAWIDYIVKLRYDPREAGR
ncbi:MAG: DUF1570 domain-containing protein [Phycisphaerae bacterium]